MIKLAADLTPEQLAGHIGEVVAKAYRDTIQKRLKANQIKPAARWAKEMLDIVPLHSSDTDKRRYNKILHKLDKAKVSHQFERINAPPTNIQPPFALSEGTNWTLVDIKALPKADK